MKVLGIFAFYDKRKEVKNYVKFLIQEMEKEIADLFVVCNGEISEDGRAFFAENAQGLLVRLNEGFDAGAYQDAILNHIGIKKMKEYDALLLFNNSFYGPIFPFGEMFEKMNAKKLDFWGITAGGSDAGNKTPYHIQSYFLMISKSILQSECFGEYWRTQEKCNTFQEAVEKFELRFTKFFLNQGYSCGTYIEQEEIEKHYDISGNILSRLGYELISEHEIPILKRKYIMLDIKESPYQNNVDVLKYINDHTDYNVDFIWDDIIKGYTPYELNLRRFLRYIISPYFGKNYDIDKIVIIIYSAHYIEYVNFLNQFARNVKVIVMGSDEGSCNVEKCINDYVVKDESCFWDVFRNILSDNRSSTEICVVTDQSQSQSDIDRKRTIDDICNKLFYSSDYIGRIHNLFEENHRLGILLPEEECNFNFFEHMGKRNRLTEKNIEILSALKYDFEFGQDEKILESFGCFWCRSQIFDFLFMQEDDIKYTKEEIISVLPYLARRSGYFTAFVNNAETMNKEYSLKCQIVDNIFGMLNSNTVYSNLEEGICNLLKESIIGFSCRYKGVYIYGMGFYGKKCLGVLRENNVKVIGFLVTSNTGKQQVMSYRVWCIDDIKLGKNEAIIVALSKKNQKEVYEKLKKFPQNQIYYI